MSHLINLPFYSLSLRNDGWKTASVSKAMEKREKKRGKMLLFSLFSLSKLTPYHSAR